MYQVLYRKWRPQAFSDVSGQDSVTTALKNELREDRLAHAYLFTGSRGTGKTTCAKILAKAVNCLHPKDGDPCNECDVCRGIDSGAVTDVVEIDAASNNGVDNIRELREEVNFTPAVAKYRVYIIDEVHMLSPGAFNALLKTLEEPPPHVIFILATTEVHKLPATILSRCQRFDFRRIAPEAIAARLSYVAEQEGISLDGEAATLLARLADGALRDALSLLDQCVSRSKQVTVEVVAEAAGLAGRDYLFELSAQVRRGDSGGALALIDRLYNDSKDMERLCAEWIDYFRNLMILKSVPGGDGLVVAPPAELKRMEEEAAQFDLPAILQVMTVLQRTLERLRGGASRRVEMEMAVLRLCSPELDTGTEGLLRRIKALEDAVRGGLPAAPPLTGSVSREAPPPAAPSVPPKPAEAAEPEAIPLPDAPPDEAAFEGEAPFAKWPDVLENLAESCAPLYGVLADSTAVLRGEHLLICTDNELFRTLVGRDGNKAVLLAAVRAAAGRNYRIGIKKASPPPAADEGGDPLAAFLRSSREQGVDIRVQE